MSHKTLGIGALSKLTGVKIETIRYYERQKLLVDPPRTEGGHRCYGQGHLKRLSFIRRSRELGFSMEEIRELLVMVDGDSYTCGEIKALTVEHAKCIRGKINDLEKIEATLLSISARCKGGKIPECPIVDALSSV
jgi:MerR family mercuric resistance operon transcriptional regulator